MIVEEISLTNFRNYETAKFVFGNGINVLVGKNAQGKTNLLEAIYFCSIGKSDRASKENELIRWGRENSKISLNTKSVNAESKIEVIFSKKAKKTIKINNIPIKKISELLGELKSVFFSPDELKLIKESPADRRRFMDISISQVNKVYFNSLMRYEKILASRNKLLKTESNPKLLADMLGVYNTQLATYGSKIIILRQQFIKNLAPFATLAHSYLTSGKENLEIKYTGLLLTEENSIKAELLEQYQKNIEKDVALGFTCFGPHRDDIKVCVDGTDVRMFGSQGQQRTAALSLKLAELEIIKNECGQYPILILDDVLSELDESRKQKLLNFCVKTQTFISCTKFDEKKCKLNCNVIKIENNIKK